MPAEHEIEAPSGVAAIGSEESGRGHNLSYPGIRASTTRNAERADRGDDELQHEEHEGHEDDRPYFAFFVFFVVSWRHMIAP
jgi:hypothetical protein